MTCLQKVEEDAFCLFRLSLFSAAIRIISCPRRFLLPHPLPISLIMRFSLTYFVLLLSLALVALSAPVPEALPEPAPEAAVGTSDLEKRGYSGKATWYNAGLGACGKWNSGSDKIVALSPSRETSVPQLQTSPS